MSDLLKGFSHNDPDHDAAACWACTDGVVGHMALEADCDQD